MSAPACGACGGALQGRTFSGQSAEVCTVCGSVLLSAPVALALLGTPAELPPTSPQGAPDPVPAEAPETAAGGVWPLRLAILLGLSAAAVAVPLLMFVSQRNAELEEQATTAAQLEEPPVPAATASNVQRLVDEGWTLVAEDPKRAAEQFRSALALTPRDGAASYGLGYALLRSGEKVEATQHLCRAKSYADRDTSREVANLLEHEGLTCP